MNAMVETPISFKAKKKHLLNIFEIFPHRHQKHVQIIIITRHNGHKPNINDTSMLSKMNKYKYIKNFTAFEVLFSKSCMILFSYPLL